jgi:hypothetical protein
MLGSSKTGAVRAFVTASSARSRDADLYRHYAAGLYRQALLTRGDPVPAEHVACDVIVNERALARMPERGEDDARYRLSPRGMAALLYAVIRRQAPSSAVVAEDASQVRRPATGGQ